jgi:hypothetical protein
MNVQVNNVEASKAIDRFMIVFTKQAVLPVSFLSLYASRNNNKTVDLLWKTANELNLKNFEIQRSINGISFTSIATTMPSFQTSNASMYSYTDKDLQGGDLFYRIKAISIGGKLDHSSVAKLSSAKGKFNIGVHPNPVLQKQIHIGFENMEKGLYPLVLTNSMGQKVFMSNVSITAANGSQILNLGPSLPVGAYQMSITAPSGFFYSEQIMVK